MAKGIGIILVPVGIGCCGYVIYSLIGLFFGSVFLNSCGKGEWSCAGYIPRSVINNVQVFHNIERDGQKGIGYNIDYEIKGADGGEYKLQAIYFDATSNTLLNDTDGKFANIDGFVAVSSPIFKTDNKSARYLKYGLFMPYNQIHTYSTLSRTGCIVRILFGGVEKARWIITGSGQ